MRRWRLLVVLVAGCSAGAPGLIEVTPPPRSLKVYQPGPVVKTACVDTAALPAHDRLDALVPQLLAGAGLAGGDDDCDWQLRVTSAAMDGEYFAVHSDDSAHTELQANSERAALYALQSALQTLDGARPVAVDLVDHPDIAVRGVIEGFYGQPYLADERAGVLHRMMTLRQNKYVYCPQNEDYAHDLWAEPYPSELGADLAAAAAQAEASLIDFVWAFRPGVNLFGWTKPEHSIRYSSDDDFARLTAKLEAMRQLGVHAFGMFIDDSKNELYWPEDVAAFSAPVAAHAALANRLQAYLASQDPSARLLFISPVYTAYTAGWQDYNQQLGALLDPAVDVMWTGNLTYSKTIAAADLTAINQLLGRQVVIWDNAPSSVMPLQGRSADLYTATSAFLSNPVLNEWRAHAVLDFYKVMGPLGWFAWNGGNYDPDRAMSWWNGQDQD